MNGQSTEPKIQRAILTKEQLIKEVARVIEIPQNAAHLVMETILDSMVRALRTGDKVEIRGFGNFRLRQRGSRTGRNPRGPASRKCQPRRLPTSSPARKSP